MLTDVKQHTCREWRSLREDLPYLLQWNVWPGILLRICTIFLGCLAISIAVNFFVVPARLADGGFTGIALIINYMYGIDLNDMVVWLNIPLVLMGIPLLGYRLIINTILGVSMLPPALVLTNPLQQIAKDWHIQTDPWISVLVGGILMGLGLGLVLRVNANTGGSDLVALIVKHCAGIPLNYTLLFFDISVLLCAWPAVGSIGVMYTLPYMFAYTSVVKIILENFGPAYTIMIISPRIPLIIHKIQDRNLNIDYTVLKGKNSQDNRECDVIYTVVSAKELGTLRNLVEEIDPFALITVQRCKKYIQSFRSKISHHIGNHWRVS